MKTNLPNELREIWTDAYKLFDVCYTMPNTVKAWEWFTPQVDELGRKHGNSKLLTDLLTVIADFTDTRQKQEEKDGKTLSWGKDEDYPYPREEGGI